MATASSWNWIQVLRVQQRITGAQRDRMKLEKSIYCLGNGRMLLAYRSNQTSSLPAKFMYKPFADLPGGQWQIFY